MTRLVSCYFGREPDWERMARVLEFSARRDCAGWDIDVRRIDPPARTHGLSASRVSNTHKLDWWTEQVERAEDGTRLLLIDVDTMILGPLEAAWQQDFDLAYTVKDGRFPFNAGVIFLRVSVKARIFMRLWRDENRKMFENPDYQKPWYQRFGGMNQSALGKLLTENLAEPLGIKLGTLPCSVWNCENATWADFDSGTRIVHLKSGLRLAALATGDGSTALMPMVRIWRALEREAA